MAFWGEIDDAGPPADGKTGPGDGAVEDGVEVDFGQAWHIDREFQPGRGDLGEIGGVGEEFPGAIEVGSDFEMVGELEVDGCEDFALATRRAFKNVGAYTVGPLILTF